MSDDIKRLKISGRAISVRGNDIDTDRIIPARYLKCVTFDSLGAHAFEDDRSQLKEKGQTHSFDKPAFANATLLFVNKNFGCGSSREHAPQAIMRWGKGIKAIVGESFAEIFFGNCTSLGIPAVLATEADIQKLIAANEADPNLEFTVDLQNLKITFGGESVPITMNEGARQSLMAGRWDSAFELLEAKDQIKATAARLPYVSTWKTA